MAEWQVAFTLLLSVVTTLSLTVVRHVLCFRSWRWWRRWRQFALRRFLFITARADVITRCPRPRLRSTTTSSDIHVGFFDARRFARLRVEDYLVGSLDCITSTRGQYTYGWNDVTESLHCVPIKTPTFHFMNNSVKNEVILIIFGIQNPEEISHK